MDPGHLCWVQSIVIWFYRLDVTQFLYVDLSQSQNFWASNAIVFPWGQLLVSLLEDCAERPVILNSPRPIQDSKDDSQEGDIWGLMGQF